MVGQVRSGQVRSNLLEQLRGLPQQLLLVGLQGLHATAAGLQLLPQLAAVGVQGLLEERLVLVEQLGQVGVLLGQGVPLREQLVPVSAGDYQVLQPCEMQVRSSHRPCISTIRG